MKQFPCSPQAFHILLLGMALFSSGTAESITVAEKKDQFRRDGSLSSPKKALRSIHDQLCTKKNAIRQLYHSIHEHLEPFLGESQKIDEKQLTLIEPLRQQIKQLQEEISNLEKEWKELSGEDEEEIEGLWHQPDTTIGQLVLDYSTSDAIYVMPPDIAGSKIHLSSKLPIPKASWNELLDLIMANAGIGVRTLSPFVKQLFFTRQYPTGALRYISDDRTLLDTLAPDSKIAFVCSPPSGELRRILQFLERFAPPDQLFVQIIGGNLVLIGKVHEIKELMKVYDFVAAPKRAQEYRIVTLQRGDSEEVAKILSCIFEGESSKVPEMPTKGASSPNFTFQDSSFGFRVIPLKFPASSLFFMGKHEQIEKACQIVADLEKSIGEVQQRNIHWYSCRHSDAEELAKVLSQVYNKMMNLPNTSFTTGSTEKKPTITMDFNEKIENSISPINQPQDALMVQPPPIVGIGKPKSDETTAISENFVVDPKTNSIIMVVENSIYPHLKDLLQKLDVPKRMVQIDVLLFEKKVLDSSSMGLNRLKMADAASKKNRNGLNWSDPLIQPRTDDDHYDQRRTRHHKGRDSRQSRKYRDKAISPRGILEFFYSRGRSGWFPAYDLAYQFLLTQEDVQINANPTVVTVNQTPARISVVEQISINTGAVEFDRDHFKDAYTRAEYGITIQITPTVHAKIDDITSDEPKFVTLTTDIVFDTPQSDHHDRPDVTRRNIKNEVRVQDGETVILGGLRRKHSGGKQQMIPFLGELPGIGKLFSMTELADTNVEMFIFLTPRILSDDHEKWKQARLTELMKRPGDTPEFLSEVIEAKKTTRNRLMERSLRMVLGKPDVST